MQQTYLKPPTHFTREEFRAYVAGRRWTGWRPLMPYLHNTGVPSLAQWEALGATPQERWGANLDNYYAGMGWHAGPHAVACPDYIWALCDFTLPGVAQSCSNSFAWAIEMVGSYEIGGDDFSTGDGAKVRDNAAFAIAEIADAVGWGDLSDFVFNKRGLHLHHDCAQDHHACPGSKVSRADMLARIASFRRSGAPQIEVGGIVGPIGSPVPAAPPAPLALISTDDIQAALVKLGFGPLTIDGDYGPRTQAAVKAFQTAHSLFVDGWVGPDTRKAILAALGNK